MGRCAVAVPEVFVFVTETAEERRTARVGAPGELDWAAAMLSCRPPPLAEPPQTVPDEAVQIDTKAPPLNETSASKLAAASRGNAARVAPTNGKASTYVSMGR